MPASQTNRIARHLRQTMRNGGRLIHPRTAEDGDKELTTTHMETVQHIL